MRFLHHLPIRKKIVAVTMLASIAALLLTGGALFSYEYHGYRRSMERDLSTLARIIGANSVAAISFGDRAAAEETLSALRAEPRLLAAAIYDSDNRDFAHFSREGHAAKFPVEPAADGFVRRGDRLLYFESIEDERERRRVGTLYFETDFSGMRRRLLSYAEILGLVLAVATLVALALSAALQRFVSQPIINLVAATKRVTLQRDYSHRVERETNDEFGQLISGFNEMLQQIESRDATLLEKNTALQEANKELESFSYSVSHDLRAPLRHIQGYVAILQRSLEGKLEEKPQRYLRVINSASVEMGQLIDDLLDFSRMGRTEMKQHPVQLDSLVEEVVSRFKPDLVERNMVWRIEPLPTVLGDGPMLRQVFANLVGNAVKYSRQRDPAIIEIGPAGREDGFVTLLIRDNGAGFDMAYADKLFGVFQRLHRADEFEGTGIGLATVRRILTRHGGRIWAEGAVDKGATFYFTLPLATVKTGSKSPFNDDTAETHTSRG